MIPLASNSAYPFPEAELGGKAFWVPPVRHTGFLHPAAVVSVGIITQGCPRVISALSTLFTGDSGTKQKVFDVANKPQRHSTVSLESQAAKLEASLRPVARSTDRSSSMRYALTFATKDRKGCHVRRPPNNKATTNEINYPYVVEVAVAFWPKADIAQLSSRVRLSTPDGVIARGSSYARRWNLIFGRCSALNGEIAMPLVGPIPEGRNSAGKPANFSSK